MSIALAYPAVACMSGEGIVDNCFKSPKAQHSLRKTVLSVCGLAKAVKPCANEIKAVVSGPAGSECDIMSNIPPQYAAQLQGVTPAMIFDKISSDCDNNPLGNSEHSKIVRQGLSTLTTETVSHAIALRALILGCAAEQDAVQQCLTSKTDMQDVMERAHACGMAVCQTGAAVLPCIQDRTRPPAVCAQDANTLTEIGQGLGMLQQACDSREAAAISTKAVAPTFSGGAMLPVFMFLALLGFVAYQRVPQKEEDVQEWSYGTV